MRSGDSPELDAGQDRGLFGDDARSRWAMGLSTFVIFIFTEIWMKPFNGGGVSAPDNDIIRSLYYPGYLAGLGLVALGPWRVAAGVIRTPLVWALVAYAFVSTRWSIDGAVTERRAIALLFCTLAGAAVATQLSWRQLTRALALVFSFACVGSFLAAVLIPKFGRMQVEFPGAWSGLFIEKNGLGAASAQTIVFCGGAFLLDRPRRWWWAAGAGLGAALLLLSTSKTSLVVAFIGCFCLALAWGVRRGPATAVAATFVGVVGLGGLLSTVVLSPASLLGVLGKDATLTGRTRIWAAVMRQVATRPHTGFGYGAVWTDQSGWGPVFWVVKQYGARPTYAHNGWVDLWLALGDYAVWLGVALVLVTWIVTIAVTYRRSDAVLALPYVAMFTVNNFTESSMIWYNSIGWVLFVAFATRLVSPDPARSPRPWPARPAAEAYARPALA